MPNSEPPADADYFSLLKWHFERGTRPIGNLILRWKNKELANAVGKTPRATSYWFTDRRPPLPDAEGHRKLLGAFFGSDYEDNEWYARQAALFDGTYWRELNRRKEERLAQRAASQKARADLELAVGGQPSYGQRASVGAPSTPTQTRPQNSRDGMPNGARISTLPYGSIADLFVGRSNLLAFLDQELATPPVMPLALSAVALYGLGGTGKTRAAVEFGIRSSDRYRAVLLVHAGSLEALRAGLADLAATVNRGAAAERPMRSDDGVRWLRENDAWLLILDNADSTDVLTEINKLIGMLAHGHVIVTSRLSTFPANIRPYEVRELASSIAASFLLDRTADYRPITETDPHVAEDLAEALGGLPVALEHAGAFIAVHRLTMVEYLMRWRLAWESVATWAAPAITHYPRAVAATWHLSVEALTTDGKGLLDLMSWMSPAPIRRWLLKTPSLHMSSSAHENGLTELMTYSLARVTYNDAFEIHTLVQEVTRYNIPHPLKRDSFVAAAEWLALVSNDIVSRAVTPHIQNVLTWASEFDLKSDLRRRLLRGFALHHDIETGTTLESIQLLQEAQRSEASDPLISPAERAWTEYLLAAKLWDGDRERALQYIERAISIHDAAGLYDKAYAEIKRTHAFYLVLSGHFDQAFKVCNEIKRLHEELFTRADLELRDWLWTYMAASRGAGGNALIESMPLIQKRLPFLKRQLSEYAEAYHDVVEWFAEALEAQDDWTTAHSVWVYLLDVMDQREKEDIDRVQKRLKQAALKANPGAAH